MAKKKFAEMIKSKFDYDVEDLEEYIDEQSDEIFATLINDGSLSSKMTLMDNVRGKEKIKLIDTDVSLQAAASCGWSADGGVILTDETIENERLKVQIEFCNEDLIGTWAQLAVAAGANRQDQELPSFGDIMIGHIMKKTGKLNNELIMNGDEDSVDPNLAFYDGLKKRWLADADFNVYDSDQNEITSANAFDIAIGMWGTIPTVVKRNAAEIGLELNMGWETAQKILDQIYADKDYNALTVDVSRENGEISFIIPTTNLRVQSLVELDGTEEMFAIPWYYVYFATDVTSDIDGFEADYNPHDERIRVGAKFRSGIQYVYSLYFTRLNLLPES